MLVVLLYLQWFWHISLLKCVSQPKIVQKSIKTLTLAFKVIQSHWFWCKSKASVRLLIVINSNLGTISHRFWDMVAYLPKITIFFTLIPMSFSAPAQGDLFRIYGKVLRILSLPGSQRWRFSDPSLQRFWLIHPCDRQADRIAMVKTCYSSSCCRVLKWTNTFQVTVDILGIRFFFINGWQLEA